MNGLARRAAIDFQRFILRSIDLRTLLSGTSHLSPFTSYLLSLAPLAYAIDVVPIQKDRKERDRVANRPRYALRQ